MKLDPAIVPKAIDLKVIDLRAIDLRAIDLRAIDLSDNPVGGHQGRTTWLTCHVPQTR
jgi:hypothetical protein